MGKISRNRHIPVILTIAAVLLGTAVAAGGSSADLLEIERVASYYLNAGKAGDVDMLRKAFHPSARLQFVKKGQYGEWSAAEYISWRKPGKKSQYESEILSIDCTGNAALVKTEMDFGTHRFIDYLSLLKIEGRWWIVNKIFYKHVPGGE